MQTLNITEERLDSLIKKAVNERCEISIEVSPELETITIRPWEPLRYVCPYKTE